MRGRAWRYGRLGRTERRNSLALRATPLGRIAGAALLPNGEIQCGSFLAAAGAYRGNRVTGLDDVASVTQQALVVTIQAQVAIAMVKNYKQAGAA